MRAPLPSLQAAQTSGSGRRRLYQSISPTSVHACSGPEHTAHPGGQPHFGAGDSVTCHAKSAIVSPRRVLSVRHWPTRSCDDLMDASIIITTYRRESLLSTLVADCIAQIRALPELHIDVWVIDNSPDASARAHVDQSTEVHFVHEPRPGVSHARNRGIADSAGRCIIFIDDDERPAPGWLAALLTLQKDTNADVLFGPVHPQPVDDATPMDHFYTEFVRQDSDAPAGAAIARHTPWAGFKRGLSRRPLASNNTLLLRSRCIFDAAPFDPSLGQTGGEDTLFFTDLQRKHRRLLWCPDAVVTESVPADRRTLQFYLRRKFRNGQITTSTCLKLAPAEHGLAVAWMATGLLQCLIGLLFSAMWPFDRLRGYRGLGTVATGLGKLFYHERFRQIAYGQAQVSTPV